MGERTRYDERLTRFLLERHDPRGHGYLHDVDPSWAAKRDTLGPRLARLPRLLAKMFGVGDDAAGEGAETPAAPAGKRRRA